METNREHIEKFALETYRELQHNRHYALTPDSKNVLTALATALYQKRAAENRK